MAEKMAKLFQETLDQQRHELKVPGISAAVILPDCTAWLGVSGKSSDSEVMNSVMLFGLGSVTKTYIAALVLQLAQEGALALEDSVGDSTPELGQIDGNIASTIARACSLVFQISSVRLNGIVKH